MRPQLHSIAQNLQEQDEESDSGNHAQFSLFSNAMAGWYGDPREVTVGTMYPPVCLSPLHPQLWPIQDRATEHFRHRTVPSAEPVAISLAEPMRIGGLTPVSEGRSVDTDPSGARSSSMSVFEVVEDPCNAALAEVRHRRQRRRCYQGAGIALAVVAVAAVVAGVVVGTYKNGSDNSYTGAQSSGSNPRPAPPFTIGGGGATPAAPQSAAGCAINHGV